MDRMLPPAVSDTPEPVSTGQAKTGAPEASDGASPEVHTAPVPVGRVAVDGTPPARPVAVVVWLVFALALLKGLRMPNLWATTHLTFNYSGGFIRRGLVGELLRRLGGQRVFQYNRLALISIVIFVAAAIVMARLVARTLRTDGRDPGLIAAVLTFAASPGLVFFIHVIGYLDYLGLFAVTLIILVSSRTRRRFAVFYAAAAIGVVLALVHEAQTLMFGPTIFFVLLCHVVRASRPPGVSRATRVALTVHALAVPIIMLCASTIVSALGTKSPATITALQNEIGRHTNFPLRGDAFATLRLTTREVAFTVIPGHWSNPESRPYLINSFVATVPGLGFLIYYGIRSLRRIDLPRRARRALTAVFVAACLAPELLHFLGWDAARWNALSVLACVCCLSALRLFLWPGTPPGAADAAARRVADPWTLVAAAAAVLLGLSTSYTNFLFDGYAVSWFPFETRWAGAAELLRGGFTFIPRN